MVAAGCGRTPHYRLHSEFGCLHKLFKVGGLGLKVLEFRV